MPISRVVVWVLSFVAMYETIGAACADSYPSKPVRIVTGAVGGGGDFAARLIGQALSSALGQPVIVDNRGGSVTIPAGIAAKAPPDGYTLFNSGSILWLTYLLQETPYDPVRDFLPVTLTGTSPNILLVQPSLPAKTARELVGLIKSRPGEFNYGSGPTGSANHLAAELFKSMAGVSMVRVSYQGVGPALSAVIGGEVQLTFASTSSAMPHIKSGRLNALAVTSAQPSALAPGIPTLASAALPGYEMVAIDGVFVPAGTPTAIIAKLNQEIVRVLNRAEIKERYLASGAETVGSSPNEFGAKVKSEISKWAKVIREAGVRSN